jgi:hypothetical protein
MSTLLSYSIHPVEQADIPTLAKFLQASKLPLVINRLLFKHWPNETAQKKIYTGAIEGAFENSLSEMSKVVDGISGEIVAHLVITRKKAQKEDIADSNKSSGSVPEAMNPKIFHLVTKAVKEIVKEVQELDHIGKFSSSFHNSSVEFQLG